MTVKTSTRVFSLIFELVPLKVNIFPLCNAFFFMQNFQLDFKCKIFGMIEKLYLLLVD